MKLILAVLALSALCLQVSYAVQPKACAEGCFQAICIKPYGSDNDAKKKCSANLELNMKCVNDSCAKDSYSDSCIQKRCTKDRSFLDFTHCYSDCYGKIETGIEFTFQPIDQLETKTNRIHNLTKKNTVNGQTNPTPTPQPNPQPAKPKPTSTFSGVMTFALAAISFVFVF